MVAIDNDYVDMVKFLLDHGANTDVEAEVITTLGDGKFSQTITLLHEAYTEQTMSAFKG